MSSLFGALLLCFLTRSALGQVQNDTGKLVAVSLVFRHGDRVIVKPYPKDPYENASYWPAGWGQLTNLGKMQEYQLGLWLRNRYATFLPAKYSEKDIYIYSTDVDRTLMSAESTLAGLYPPTADQIWDRAIPWQPIPIHTRPVKEDYLLAMEKPCARYNVLREELLKSREFVDLRYKFRDLFKYVAENTGTEIDSFESLEYIYSTLFIEDSNNFTLPSWTRRVYPDQLKPLAGLSFAVPCYTEPMARLKAGLFFNELIRNIRNVTDLSTNRSRNRKFWVYSAHDTTIANILQALRIFTYHSPPYTSTVLFETRTRDDKNFYVNILYKNSTEPQRMTLEGCEYDCPLDDFVRLLKPIVLNVDEWNRECKPSLFMAIGTVPRDDLLVIAGVLLIAMTIFVIVIKLIFSKYGEKGEAVYLRLPDDEEQA